MIKRAVVDFSAFLSPAGEPVVKELSIADVGSMSAQHWIFKQPKEDMTSATARDDRNWSHQSVWLAKYYHGIDYYAGYTEYTALRRALDLCSDFHLLYAPTREKAVILEGLMCPPRAVFSLEDLGCTKLPNVSMSLTPAEEGKDDEPEGCLYHLVHAPRFNCTLRNVRMLAAWCKDNLDKIDMHSVDNREKTFTGDWPCAHPTARQLAEQGFVRVHTDKDSTKCVYCGVVLHRWMPEDDVDHDHEHNSPFCKFVKRKRQLANQLKDSMLSKAATAIKDPTITERELFDICSS